MFSSKGLRTQETSIVTPLRLVKCERSFVRGLVMVDCRPRSRDDITGEGADALDSG